MIAEALNAKYVENELQQRFERPWKIGPSNLGDCLRKTAFLLQGQSKVLPPPPESLRVFELGHQRGERLEELCKDIWPDARTQVPVRIMAGKHEIKGTADLWLPSKRLVVDFKTAGSYSAGLLSSEGPSADYQLQVHAYRMGIAEAETIAPMMVTCLIVYEAKDSDARRGVKAGQLIECPVPWDSGLVERYEARLAELAKLMDLKESRKLDPFEVDGLPKNHWKCRNGADGQPLYCSIGSKQGRCHG